MSGYSHKWQHQWVDRDGVGVTGGNGYSKDDGDHDSNNNGNNKQWMGVNLRLDTAPFFELGGV
jgi:hypothetical protein